MNCLFCLFLLSSVIINLMACSSRNTSEEEERLRVRNVELATELTRLQLNIERSEKELERLKDLIDDKNTDADRINLLLSNNINYFSTLVLPTKHLPPFGTVEMRGYSKEIIQESSDGGSTYPRKVFIINETDPLLLEFYWERINKGNRINLVIDERVAVYFTPPDRKTDLELLNSSNENNMVRIYSYLYHFGQEIGYSRVPDNMKIMAVYPCCQLIHQK